MLIFSYEECKSPAYVAVKCKGSTRVLGRWPLPCVGYMCITVIQTDIFLLKYLNTLASSRVAAACGKLIPMGGR